MLKERNEVGTYREAKMRKAKGRKKRRSGIAEWFSSFEEVQRTRITGFRKSLLHVASESPLRELC